jgi:ActR/RegA family two-component response regulator
MRVLLVEPDDAVRGRIAAALERRGCTVLSARGYGDAVKLLLRARALVAACVAEVLAASSGPDLLAVVGRRVRRPISTVLRVSNGQSVVARALAEAGGGVIDRDAPPDAVADAVLDAIARSRAPTPATRRRRARHVAADVRSP